MKKNTRINNQLFNGMDLNFSVQRKSAAVAVFILQLETAAAAAASKQASKQQHKLFKWEMLVKL